MRCRECNSTNTRVTCTDHYDKFTKRYCRCLDCGAKFRTVEQYEKPKPGPAFGKRRPGKISRGESHGAAIFKEDDIRRMRALSELGHTHQQIAVEYGTSLSYVSKIVNRKAWKHIQ